MKIYDAGIARKPKHFVLWALIYFAAAYYDDFLTKSEVKKNREKKTKKPQQKLTKQTKTNKAYILIFAKM